MIAPLALVTSLAAGAQVAFWLTPLFAAGFVALSHYVVRLIERGDWRARQPSRYLATRHPKKVSWFARVPPSAWVGAGGAVTAAFVAGTLSWLGPVRTPGHPSLASENGLTPRAAANQSLRAMLDSQLEELDLIERNWRENWLKVEPLAERVASVLEDVRSESASAIRRSLALAQMQDVAQIIRREIDGVIDRIDAGTLDAIGPNE